jgi:hypothetical protein
MSKESWMVGAAPLPRARGTSNESCREDINETSCNLVSTPVALEKPRLIVHAVRRGIVERRGGPILFS